MDIHDKRRSYRLGKNMKNRANKNAILYMKNPKKYPTFSKNTKISRNVKTIAILLFQRFDRFYRYLKNALSSQNLNTQAMLLFQRFGKSVNSGDKA